MCRGASESKGYVVPNYSSYYVYRKINCHHKWKYMGGVPRNLVEFE